MNRLIKKKMMYIYIYIYIYEFREISRRRENKHPSRAPTCEILKRLVYFPEITSHTSEKEKQNKTKHNKTKGRYPFG